jgi:uncharacterized membrane protein YgcG
MCKILTWDAPTDAPPTVETKRKWGALEISIVTTLSTFTTVATTAAACLYHRWRKDSESSEDGVHLAIAKP